MKTPQAQPGWWDWPSVGLLFILLHITVVRLVTTEWTPNLNFTQASAYLGLMLGLALGYSQLKRSTARWLSFGYMLFLLPVIWMRVIDQQVEVDERLLSVGGRLLFSTSEFFARRPVEDTLFFVAIMSITFWVLSVSAGYNLIRHQNFLAAVLPAAIGILVMQHYDNGIRNRIWFLAFFIFFALSLLGRLKFLQDQKFWRERRIFLSPENGIDLTTGMAIASALIILVAFTLPLSFTRVDVLQQTWKRLTRPWTDFTERIENAVSALESTASGKPGEFYGTELELGRGFPLSDSVMFRVQVPTLPFEQKPPRYYWRGRTYDYFSNEQWYTTGTTRDEFSPTAAAPLVADSEGRTPATFTFTVGESKFALLYSPSQAVWVSRPGSYLAAPAAGALNIYSWNASPTLLPGETYQVNAAVKNPTIEVLRAAGTEYPQWVTEKYLQLPSEFPTSIQTLAEEITAQAETPYDKATAITRYLRENIEYAPTIPAPPANVDPLEWLLFDYKKGYCVYYATSEIMMLRSIGIPARMAVGFAQGTGSSQEGLNLEIEEIEADVYTVRKNNAHAWPEVYFPEIGWVEFEPTGNQSPLDRPLALRETANNPIAPNLSGQIPESEPEVPEDRFDQVEDNSTTIRGPFTLTTYLLLLLIPVAALTIYFSRRYNVSARVPNLVRTTIERTGLDVPAWVLRWERWSALPAIARAFESINFGLRWVGQPAPVHATPSERAESLMLILPQLAPPIKVLLDEHQTSLYTSRVADEKNARSSAFQIRTQVILALIRYFWTGHYEVKVAAPKP